MAENRAELRPCANPACDQVVTGRPNKLTCSPRCRKAFQRHRDAMLRDAQSLLEALGEADVYERLYNDPGFAAWLTETTDLFLRTRVMVKTYAIATADPRRRGVTRKTASKRRVTL